LPEVAGGCRRWRNSPASLRQISVLPEAALPESSIDRFGWGEKGKRVPLKVGRQKSRHLSLLPALSVDGYIACELYDGAVDAERFADFIENKVLPKCNPFPGPRSVLIFDNASIHRGPVMSFIYIKNTCFIFANC